MRRSHYLVLILLLICQTSFGQIYQNMAQPGYKFSRARFDSVLTIPTSLGNLKNISGGQDTGQIRFNKSDSSVYVWNGRAWIKAGGGTIPTLTQVLESAAGANEAGANQIKDLAAGTSQFDAATFGQLTDTANLRLRISDTASMLSNYAKTAAVALKLNISDTATMLAPYTRVTVTSYGKNATRDSTILLLSNGTRYAAKDSVGGGGGGSNIYTADGSLTSARTLTLNSYPLTILGTQPNRFHANGNMTFGPMESGGGTPNSDSTYKLSLVNTNLNYLRFKRNASGADLLQFTSSADFTTARINAGGFLHLAATNGIAIGGTARLTLGANLSDGLTPVSIGYESWRSSAASAILDIRSSTQGLLIPRMTLTQRNAIATPAAGLQVIVTGETGGEFLSFYNSSTAAWQRVVKLTSAGRLLLGTTTESTYILDVVGDARINGVTIGRGNLNDSRNTALGFEALLNQQSNGVFNTAVGYRAGKNLSSVVTGFNSQNTFIGGNAGLNHNTGEGNTAVGYNALSGSTSSTNNVAVGRNALGGATTGSGNVGVGAGAAQGITTGESNVAIGQSALNLNTTSSFNTAVGWFSLQNTTGERNSGFGDRALNTLTSGTYNSAHGQQSLFRLTTGGFNTAIGAISGFDLTSGSNNIFLGYEAGRFAGSGTTQNQTSTNSIYLGYSARASANGNTNEIIVGYNEVGLGSNTTIIGNSSTTLTALRGSLVSGATSVNASAQLEVSSTTKGVLFPRMTTVQKLAIGTPAAGLQVYDSTLNQMSYYNGTTWVNF